MSQNILSSKLNFTIISNISPITHIAYAGNFCGNNISDIFTDRVILCGKRNLTDVINLKNDFYQFGNGDGIGNNHLYYDKNGTMKIFNKDDGLIMSGDDYGMNLYIDNSNIYPLGNIDGSGKTSLGATLPNVIGNLNSKTYKGYEAIYYPSAIGKYTSIHVSNPSQDLRIFVSTPSLVVASPPDAPPYPDFFFFPTYVSISHGLFNISGNSLGSYITGSNLLCSNNAASIIYGKNTSYLPSTISKILPSISIAIPTIFASSVTSPIGYTILMPGFCYSSIIGYDNDVNNDLYNDFGFVSPSQIAVIYGGDAASKSGFALKDMTSSQGFMINVINSTSANAGFLIKNTNDKFSDILVSNPNSYNNTGSVFLVPGLRNSSNINVTAGEGIYTEFIGENPGDFMGSAISEIGDINNDNMGDFAICSPKTNANTGSCYILFGQTSYPKFVQLKDLDMPYGFKITGNYTNDQFGYKVTKFGDVNADGTDDYGILSFGINTVYVILGNHVDHNQAKSSSETLSHQKTFSQSQTFSHNQTNSYNQTNHASISASENSTNTKSQSITESISSSETNTGIFNYVKDTSLSTVQSVSSYAISSSTVVGTLAMNPSSVTAAYKLQTLTASLNCQSSLSHDQPLSYFESPITTYIPGVGDAGYSVGAILTNIGICVGIAAAAYSLGSAFAAYKGIEISAGFAAFHLPGVLTIPNVFFSVPIAKAATIAITYGNNIAKVIAAGAMILQIADIAYYGYNICKNFDATFSSVENEWVPGYGNSNFLFQFKFSFDAYRPGMQNFGIFDRATALLSGVASAFNLSGDDNCSNAFYIISAINVISFTTLVATRPFLSKWENVYYIGTSGLALIPTAIGLATKINPELEDNKTLQEVVDWSMVILNIASGLKSIFDLADSAMNMFKSFSHNHVAKSTDPLLMQPVLDSSHNTPAVTPVHNTPVLGPDHTAVYVPSRSTSGPSEHHHHYNNPLDLVGEHAA